MGWVARAGKQDTDRIGGRYRLVERLGAGGMSVVWRAYDEILGRQVAVKVLSPQLAGDDSFRDRLRQEALAAARLCHPHITGIFDFGESPLTAQLTVPYVVMELNDGESLSARLARHGALPWHDAVVVAAEVSSALATAHARGVVHRDVTPANVMLTSAGAKVVDFGISALVGQRDAAPDGSVLGTPAYLAPERLGDGQVTPAADVYALGLLLYRCLTAHLPWPADTTTEALRAHLYADPEPLPHIPGLPDEAAGLCLRCLAKQPSDRPVAAEVARTLAALAGVQAIISPLDSTFGTFSTRAFAEPATEAITAEPASLLSRSDAVSRSGAAFRLGLGGQAWPAALRLRAGLRIGKLLRLGAAQPLGGGLFAGGRLGLRASGPRPARPAFPVRHRLQAAAATVIVLVAVAVGWSAAREPAEVGPAQAAAVGAAPVVPRAVGCKVRYQVRQDDGDDFEVLLTVLNTGERGFVRWRLEFAYPGTQRLVNLSKTVDQSGRRVRLRAVGGKRLKPGRAVAVKLRGAYRGTNPLPLRFTLNGHSCDVELLGPTTVIPLKAAGAPGTPARSGVRAGARRGERKPSHPRTQKPTNKPGGFSLAV